MDTREIDPGFNDDDNNDKPDIDEIAQSLGDDDLIFEEPDPQDADGDIEIPGLEPVGSEPEPGTGEPPAAAVFDIDGSLSPDESLPELGEADMGLPDAELNMEEDAPIPLEEETLPITDDDLQLEDSIMTDPVGQQEDVLEDIADIGSSGDLEEVNLDEFNFDDDSGLPESLEGMDSDPAIDQQINAITSEFEEEETISDVQAVKDAPKQPADEKIKKKKGSKKLLKILIPVFILLAGGGYYLYMGQSKGQSKSKPDNQYSRRKKIVKKRSAAGKTTDSGTMDSREAVKNPYIYSFAENIQKSMEDGIVTYVYETKSDIGPIAEFYRSRLVSNGYKLKVQDYDEGRDYAHLIFSRSGKDCSVILKKKRGVVAAVVSYIE